MVPVGDDQREMSLDSVEGDFRAIEVRRGHMSAPMSMGNLEGRVVARPLHDARFDVATGKHIILRHLGGTAGAAVERTGMDRVMDATGPTTVAGSRWSQRMARSSRSHPELAFGHLVTAAGLAGRYISMSVLIRA
jgi:hypothetical protein